MPVIRRIFRILNRVVAVLAIILLGCNLYVIGARYICGVDQPAVFGWSWAVVISGSMEDAISVNDLVVIHEQDHYTTGDIITFRSNGAIITHRITAKTPDGYITKGDANNTEDLQPTLKQNVIGKVVWVIPGVGKAIEFLRTPLGMLCLVLVGVALIEIPYWLEQHKKTKKGGSRNENV